MKQTLATLLVTVLLLVSLESGSSKLPLLFHRNALERPCPRRRRLFVRRRKYALQHLKVKKAGAACSRLAFAVLTNRIHLDIMKYNRKEVPPYGS